MAESKPSMTEWLIASDAEGLKKATEAKFLQAAGSGAVSKQVLSQWLSQDRLYAQGYVNFIGNLLAKVRLPMNSGLAGMQWRVTNMLIGSLTNIKREIEFFHDVAKRYELNLEASSPGQDSYGPTTTTRAYQNFFGNASSQSALLLEGLLALWATEKCYNDAWTYASKADHGRSKNEATSDADGGALRKEFIPNWTSGEFGEFVKQIGGLVDELAAAEIRAGDEKDVRQRCGEVWKHVLWLEANFWPDL
ncbi:hypothetical protein MMC20_002253 [Loxospora ochrophaea]|nr:hypothetical protein [Loxospora ochrophaea]